MFRPGFSGRPNRISGQTRMFRPGTRDDVEGYDKQTGGRVTAKGMTVFARRGLSLRPTEVLIFGNAIGFTPLMPSMQTIGIHFPASNGGGNDQNRASLVSVS